MLLGVFAYYLTLVKEWYKFYYISPIYACQKYSHYANTNTNKYNPHCWDKISYCWLAQFLYVLAQTLGSFYIGHYFCRIKGFKIIYEMLGVCSYWMMHFYLVKFLQLPDKIIYGYLTRYQIESNPGSLPPSYKTFRN